MVSPVDPNQADIILRFGGGLHTRASEDEINEREDADGKNYILDLQNTEFRNRKPFDKLGTVPDSNEIRGLITLKQQDGTTKTAVQTSGGNVYEWTGSTFSLIGTVSATAQLRGTMQSQWTLDDKVIITDLNLVEPVTEWDGSTFQTTTTTLGNPFFAKYCNVIGERAYYANVKSGAGATHTPHLIAGSKVSDYTDLSVSGTPGGADEAFFVLTPDLRPVNGIVAAFGERIFSSQNGRLFNMSGEDAQTITINEFFPNSGAQGTEPIAVIGNDVAYGRQGRIERASGVERFGDIESDDLSVDVADQFTDFNNWTIVYNSRLRRAYCIPANQNEVWVLFNSLLEQDVSPWSKWTTQHANDFNITAIMSVWDPGDGLEYVYWGDSSGNLFRMEGSGSAGDGGNSNIEAVRTSRLFSSTFDADIHGIEGYIKYRKSDAATVTLTFEYAGFSLFNESITISLPAISDRPLYGNGIYYSDGEYYASASFNKIVRQIFAAPGSGNEFQVKISVDGTTSFRINEIGLRVIQASPR